MSHSTLGLFIQESISCAYFKKLCANIYLTNSTYLCPAAYVYAPTSNIQMSKFLFTQCMWKECVINTSVDRGA